MGRTAGGAAMTMVSMSPIFISSLETESNYVDDIADSSTGTFVDLYMSSLAQS